MLRLITRFEILHLFIHLAFIDFIRRSSSILEILSNTLDISFEALPQTAKEDHNLHKVRTMSWHMIKYLKILRYIAQIELS